MKIRPSLVITLMVIHHHCHVNLLVSINCLHKLELLILYIDFHQLLSIPILGQRRKVGMSQKMMMGGLARQGVAIRPATSYLPLPGYLGMMKERPGAGGDRSQVSSRSGSRSGMTGTKKNMAGKSMTSQGVLMTGKKSQEGGARSGGVIGSSVTLSRQSPGSSSSGSSPGKAKDQDCGFKGDRVCSGQFYCRSRSHVLIH